MARTKWVQVEMSVDQITRPFYGYWAARNVRRELADKFDRNELLHMAMLCVRRLEQIYATEHEKYKEREVTATFDPDKSSSWAKSCGTRKNNAKVLEDKYKEILKTFKSIDPDVS